MTEENRVSTKVSVTISENFENIMILMGASFSKIIKEDEHFFEDLGRKLDASFKDDDCNDNKQNLNILREELKKEKATVNAYTLTIKELNKMIEDLKKENRKLKKEVERLTCINKQLEERLDKDIALNMDCGDVE